MKITAIKAQVKNADRYSVFIDDKYAFSLSVNALIEAKLRVGQEVSESQITELKEASSVDKLFGVAVRYVAIRPRSKDEVRQYLRRKKADSQTIDDILASLISRGLLNDEDFARSWIESRRLLKSSSKRKLSAELQQKKVDLSLIDSALQEYSDLDQLKKLIEKKQNQPKYKEDQQKLLAYLARQGFNYSDIKHVLENIRDID